MKTEEEKTPTSQKKPYSLKLEAHIHEALEKKIIKINKNSFHLESKQRWITEAILEKIQQELPAVKEIESNNFEEKAKFVTIRIDQRLVDKIERIVEFYKKERGSFSIRQFMLEAIQDRLQKK